MTKIKKKQSNWYDHLVNMKPDRIVRKVTEKENKGKDSEEDSGGVSISTRSRKEWKK